MLRHKIPPACLPNSVLMAVIVMHFAEGNIKASLILLGFF